MNKIKILLLSQFFLCGIFIIFLFNNNTFMKSFILSPTGKNNENSFGSNIYISSIKINNEPIDLKELIKDSNWIVENELIVYNKNIKDNLDINLDSKIIKTLNITFIKNIGSGIVDLNKGTKVETLDLYENNDWYEFHWKFCNFYYYGFVLISILSVINLFFLYYTCIKNHFCLNFKRILNTVSAFDIGFFLLVIITNSIIISTILLFFKFSIHYYNFILAFFLTGLLYYFKTKDIGKVLFVSIINIVIMVLSTIIISSVFSAGWDGETYHKPAVAMLNDGWNPIYTSIDQYVDSSNNWQLTNNSQLIWSDAYPKASWLFAACIYNLTKNIESGKVTTLLFMIITFLLFYDYLQKKVKKGISLCISILVALNPIALNQVTQYYLDGILALTLCLLLLSLVILFDKKHEYKQKNIYFLIFYLIIWGCNLKFSGLYFTALYCVVGFILLCIQKKSFKASKKDFLFFCGSAIIAICIIGFAPYITNFIRYGNPFYGFLNFNQKSTLADTLASGIPAFSGLSNLKQFILSIFSKTTNDLNNMDALSEIIKPPFTFNMNELLAYNDPDIRLGGFGCLYSGIIALSILLAAYLACRYFLYYKKKLNYFSKVIIIFLFVVLLSSSILPGAYQARYIGQIYLIPVTLFCLFASEKYTTINRVFQYSFISLFLLLSIINIFPYSLILKNKVIESKNTVSALSSLSNAETVQIKLIRDDFSGLLFNLKDYHVNFIILPPDTTISGEFKATYYNWINYIP